MPSAVCPECHTHQATLPDGRLVEHKVGCKYAQTHGQGPLAKCPDCARSERCPGSEDWPNRALGNSRYDVTSNFASCPASTGESQCTDFPDRAHRCGEARDHYQTDTRSGDKRTHKCTCGEQWTALMGSVGQLFETVLKPSETLTTQLIMEYAGNDQAVTLLRYALHLRMSGEKAPGGNETWAEFDQRAEAFLRAHPPAHNLDHPFRGHDGAPCLFRTGVGTSGYCDRPESDPVHRNPDPDASGRG